MLNTEPDCVCYHSIDDRNPYNICPEYSNQESTCMCTFHMRLALVCHVWHWLHSVPKWTWTDLKKGCMTRAQKAPKVDVKSKFNCRGRRLVIRGLKVWKKNSLRKSTVVYSKELLGHWECFPCKSDALWKQLEKYVSGIDSIIEAFCVACIYNFDRLWSQSLCNILATLEHSRLWFYPAVHQQIFLPAPWQFANPGC